MMKKLLLTLGILGTIGLATTSATSNQNMDTTYRYGHMMYTNQQQGYYNSQNVPPCYRAYNTNNNVSTSTYPNNMPCYR